MQSEHSSYTEAHWVHFVMITNSFCTRRMKWFCSMEWHTLYLVVLKDGRHGIELHQGREGTELLSITSQMTALSLSLGKRKDTSSDGIIQA